MILLRGINHLPRRLQGISAQNRDPARQRRKTRIGKIANIQLLFADATKCLRGAAQVAAAGARFTLG